MGDPTSLRDRVLAAAAARPSATRRRARAVAAGLAAVSVAVSVAVFEGVGGFRHGAGRPLGLTLAFVAGWVAACGALTWIILGRGRSTLARRPAVVVAALAAAPLVLFVWTQIFYGAYPEPYQAVGLRCLRYTLFAAALPLASILVLRRGVEPRRPSILGAGAGVVSAAWAGVMVDLWCPLTHPAHVLVGHVAPLVVGAVVGAAVGRPLLGGAVR